MAGFFDKVKKSIDKGTAIVGAKSSTLIETNKIKQDISAASRSKKDTLLELGKKVYELNQEGTFTMEAVEGYVTKITELQARMTDLEAKIQLIQEEEKAKLDELNIEEEEVPAPVDVQSTEVEEAVAPVTPVEPVVAPVTAAPVAEEVPVVEVEAATEEVEGEATETVTGEYNG